MRAAICDDDQKDREAVAEILRQKMKKRGEHLEVPVLIVERILHKNTRMGFGAMT